MNRRHKRRKWAKAILKKRQRHPAWPTVTVTFADIAETVANTLACLARTNEQATLAMVGNLQTMRGGGA